MPAWLSDIHSVMAAGRAVAGPGDRSVPLRRLDGGQRSSSEHHKRRPSDIRRISLDRHVQWPCPFDGTRFTVFNKSNSPGIRSDRFNSLLEERNGDLWLGTESSGVTRYHRGRFTTYTTRDGLPDNSIQGIMSDEAGRLWVLSGGSIAQWQGPMERFFNISPNGPGVYYRPVLWVRQGFCGEDKEGLRCFFGGRFITYRLPRWLPRPNITAVAQDQAGNDLVGDLRGKARHDQKWRSEAGKGLERNHHLPRPARE